MKAKESFFTENPALWLYLDTLGLVNVVEKQTIAFARPENQNIHVQNRGTEQTRQDLEDDAPTAERICIQ